MSASPGELVRFQNNVNAETIRELAAHNRELTDVVRGLLKLFAETSSDSEGHYPHADHGCIECTVGTVPDEYNTGLCARHKAERLLK